MYTHASTFPLPLCACEVIRCIGKDGEGIRGSDEETPTRGSRGLERKVQEAEGGDEEEGERGIKKQEKTLKKRKVRGDEEGEG